MRNEKERGKLHVDGMNTYLFTLLTLLYLNILLTIGSVPLGSGLNSTLFLELEARHQTTKVQ